MFKFRSKIYIFLIFASSIIFVTSCGEKEKVDQTQKPIKSIESVEVDTNKAKVIKKEIIANLVGTWLGKLDKRATTLIITEQTGKEFKGKITINYRNVVNQEIAGTLNMDTKNVLMKDLLHSRYQGTYAAKLSDNLKEMNGTFTIKLDGKELKFNLNKK